MDVVHVILLLVLLIKEIDHEATQNEQGREQTSVFSDSRSDAPQESCGIADAGRNPAVGAGRAVLCPLARVRRAGSER